MHICIHLLDRVLHDMIAHWIAIALQEKGPPCSSLAVLCSSPFFRSRCPGCFVDSPPRRPLMLRMLRWRVRCFVHMFVARVCTRLYAVSWPSLFVFLVPDVGSCLFLSCFFFFCFSCLLLVRLFCLCAFSSLLFRVGVASVSSDDGLLRPLCFFLFLLLMRAACYCRFV